MPFQKFESRNRKGTLREEKNVKGKWVEAKEKKWFRFFDMLLILVNDMYVFVEWKIMEITLDKSLYFIETD